MGVNPDRFLRDPELRAALYDDADGLCQQCGRPLPDDWHADHVIPWAVTQSTDVFDMQALCPSCNRRKGDTVSMVNPPWFAIDEEKFREGQRGAYNVIVERVVAGERYTAIVLTTRYGKTDVARMTTLRLWRDGLTRNGLIIAPRTALVEQALDDDKVATCFSRYGIPLEVQQRISTNPMDRPPRPSRLKGCVLSSMSMQMAQQRGNPNILERWIALSCDAGLPPMVFMDEAHMESEENTWGRVPERLVKAGAHVVLMTATPIRADKQPIPGFPYEEVGRDTTSDGRVRAFYEVQPHWRTSLQDALAEPDPPVCQVTYQPFGITGTMEDTATGENALGNLRQLPYGDLRQELRRAIRSEPVIRTGIQYFLRELQIRRSDPRQRNTTGIIFLDSRDSILDAGEDDQIKTVKKVLKELAPALVVAVAVSEEKESVEILSRFAVGAAHGETAIDLLLVKQMASIGLDVDHLKVGLDLSNIRSYSGLFQQMMRIATRWDDPDYPDKPVLTAVYIAPDEPFIEEIIERIRKDEGDIAILVPPPPDGCGLIDVPPIGPGPTPRKTLFFPEGGELSGTLANLTDAAAPATYVVPADKFFERFPGAKQNVDKADFADWLQSQGVSSASEPTNTDRGREQISGHTNITEELNRWRGLVSNEGKKAINRRYRKAFGTSDWKAWKDEYRNITIDFWVEHKQKVGADYASTKLEDIDEVETLKKMFKNIQEELAA